MNDIRKRFKSSLKLSDDLNTVTVSYTFRGFDEALAFQKLVGAMIDNYEDFRSQSDEEDAFCKEHKEEDF